MNANMWTKEQLIAARAWWAFTPDHWAWFYENTKHFYA